MNAPATAAAGWREESRRDRLVAAQIDREREAARATLRITTRQAKATARREEAQAHTAARQQARRARAGRRAARLAWLRAYTVGLLFVPVIGVPAVLAWTAMAAYGQLLYGPPGLLLPAFSEGAMWAFAAATTLTRHRSPDRPVWHLRAGTVTSAAAGAALNFAHGITTQAGTRGLVTGLVYALVSVAGVTVHQFVTAGPRRSRAERAEARLARTAARREVAARRAALKAAAGPACPWPAPAPTLPDTRAPAPTGRTAPAPARRAHPTPGAPGVRPVGAPAPVTRNAPASGPVAGSAPAPRPARRTGTVPGPRAPAMSAEDAEREFAADLAAGRVPSQRAIKARLHVGQDRARDLHAHLSALAAAPAAAGNRPVPEGALS